MQFKDIAGQRDVINRLTKIIDSGRVSHAQMVLGDTADGTLQLALAYLQYLGCTNRQHYEGGDLRADSCGECPHCKKMAQLMHPDLHFVFPTAATSSVSGSFWSGDFMKEFREFLQESVLEAPFKARFNVAERSKGELDVMRNLITNISKQIKEGTRKRRSIDNVARDLGIESFTITWYSDDPDETTEYSISGNIKEE